MALRQLELGSAAFGNRLGAHPLDILRQRVFGVCELCTWFTARQTGALTFQRHIK